jgi:hypothetical protein|tara:strand:+ start:2679 stop:2945 length:267 start_codon:yes stop_codon:yes gene_type:complete
MKYNVVELDVDEIEECLIMRCSSFNSADRICNLLLDYFPLDQFAVSEERPVIHMRKHKPERYVEVRNVILNSNKSTGPQLIVIDGGKV